MVWFPYTSQGQNVPHLVLHSNLANSINFFSFMRPNRNAWLLVHRDTSATVLCTLDSRCADSVCDKCQTAQRLPVVSHPDEHEGFLTRNRRRTSL